MKNEITCKLTPKFIKPVTHQKKAWKAKKIPKSFYRQFQSQKIKNLIKDMDVPDETKKILDLLDNISSDNGELILDTPIDYALIFMILTHENYCFITKISFKDVEKYSIEYFKSDYSEEIEDFETLFSVSVPEEMFQLQHLYTTFHSVLNKKLMGGRSCFGVDIKLYGFEWTDGIFNFLRASEPLNSKDILLLRYGHYDLSFFPVFHDSDILSFGFVFDTQLNMFSSCASFHGGLYGGHTGLWDYFLYSIDYDTPFEESLDPDYELFDSGKLRLQYKNLNQQLENCDQLMAWVLTFFVVDFLNNNEIKDLKLSGLNKARYCNWSHYDLSKDNTHYVAETYPKTVLSIDQNFHPLFTYQQIDDLVSIFGLLGDKGNLMNLFNSQAPILKKLALSKTFMKDISSKVTDEMWREFYEVTVDFAEQEAEEKRYGLALLLGLLIWNRYEKETSDYAVRLLSSLPDDVCHPLIKTLAREHGKTRFDDLIHANF